MTPQAIAACVLTFVVGVLFACGWIVSRAADGNPEYRVMGLVLYLLGLIFGAVALARWATII